VRLPPELIIKSHTLCEACETLRRDGHALTAEARGELLEIIRGLVASLLPLIGQLLIQILSEPSPDPECENQA